MFSKKPTPKPDPTADHTPFKNITLGTTGRDFQEGFHWRDPNKNREFNPKTSYLNLTPSDAVRVNLTSRNPDGSYMTNQGQLELTRKLFGHPGSDEPNSLPNPDAAGAAYRAEYADSSHREANQGRNGVEGPKWDGKTESTTAKVYLASFEDSKGNKHQGIQLRIVAHVTGDNTSASHTGSNAIVPGNLYDVSIPTWKVAPTAQSAGVPGPEIYGTYRVMAAKDGGYTLISEGIKTDAAAPDVISVPKPKEPTHNA